MGCPIRTSPDQVLFADPRSFSQLTTSFFATGSLGILRSLFFSFSVNYRVNLCDFDCLHSQRLFRFLVAYSMKLQFFIYPSNEKTRSLSYQKLIICFLFFFTSLSFSNLSMNCRFFKRAAKIRTFFYLPNIFLTFFTYLYQV